MHFRRAIEINPQNAMAHTNLGRALFETGQPDTSFHHLRTAIRLAPQANAPWRWLAAVLAQRQFDAYDVETERELIECLSRRDIAPEDIAPAAVRLLQTDPAFHHLLEGSEGEGNDELPLDEPLLRPLARPLFLVLLENVIIQDPAFERLIAKVRRATLLAWHTGNVHGEMAHGDPALRDVLGAIAHQCFLVEYLHEERDDESLAVDQLKAAIEMELTRGGAVNEVLIALLACYRPLATVQGTDMLSASGESVMSRLILRQVQEPAQERAIAKSLPRVTPITDDVSRAVQAQYEEHPYPRWLRTPPTRHVLPIALRLRELFPHAGEAITVPERPSILIAGCGTGFVVAVTASSNPAGSILAIDLSRASLAYAARRAHESGFRNVEFVQADILELDGLQRRFDIIECAGVLHHLDDPVAGWRVLLRLLAPGGKMQLGLYSEVGRRGVVAGQRLIAQRGFGADLAGIRAARAAIRALPRDDPTRLVTKTVDFYSASGCRDLLFHVQERRFTLPDIQKILEDLGLDFLGFELDSQATLLDYRREFPLDAAATSLTNWSEFETRHPDTFYTMYQLWVTPKA